MVECGATVYAIDEVKRSETVTKSYSDKKYKTGDNSLINFLGVDKSSCRLQLCNGLPNFGK